MPTYEITEIDAQPPRPWGNDMLSYRVTLADGGMTVPKVDLSRKSSQPAPKVGERVDGTIDTSGQYGPKFKAQRSGGGGGRGKDPKERAEIRRQHSQTTALRWAELQHARGKLPDDFGTKQLMALVDHFFRDSGEAA